MIFIRKVRYGHDRVTPAVFGPYVDRDEAVAALDAYAVAAGITLNSGLPFPECHSWHSNGEVMFYIEPGQGNPGRKVVE